MGVLNAVWQWVLAKYNREPVIYLALVMAAVDYYARPHIPPELLVYWTPALAAVFGLGARQSVYSPHTVDKMTRIGA